MIVEQSTRPVRPVDPSPAAQVHGRHPLQRQSAKKRVRIVAEIDGIGIKIMEVEQQPHTGPADDALDPLRFVELDSPAARPEWRCFRRAARSRRFAQRVRGFGRLRRSMPHCAAAQRDGRFRYRRRGQTPGAPTNSRRQSLRSAAPCGRAALFPTGTVEARPSDTPCNTMLDLCRQCLQCAQDRGAGRQNNRRR